MIRNGFSLVELMVALVILGLAATAVVLTLPTGTSGLAGEASRFAVRAAALRDRAIVEARPMRLWVSASGYGFEARQGAAWQPVADRTLRTTDWPQGMTARWNGAAQGRISFDRLGMADGDAELVLADGDARQAVRIDAAGGVHVGEQP